MLSGLHVDWDRGLGIFLGLEKRELTAEAGAIDLSYHRVEVYWQKIGKKREHDPLELIRVTKTKVENGGKVWELVGIGGDGELVRERTLEILIED